MDESRVVCKDPEISTAPYFNGEFRAPAGRAVSSARYPPSDAQITCNTWAAARASNSRHVVLPAVPTAGAPHILFGGLCVVRCIKDKNSHQNFIYTRFYAYIRCKVCNYINRPYKDLNFRQT